MKKLLAAVLAGSMILSMAACGTKEEKPVPATTVSGNTEVDTSSVTELVFWHNRAGGAGELLEQTMIPGFNDSVGKELGIKITPVYQSSADIISKLKALILAKDVANLPDLVQIFAGDAEYMSTVPYVVPAQTLIENDDSFTTDEILPQLLKSYTISDTLYSMPFHASTMIMYYNKTAFAEAGLDPEKAPETLADVAEIAPKLLKKDSSGVKQYAITMAIENVVLNHFINGQGEYSFVGNNQNGRAGRMTEVEFDKNGTMKAFLTEWEKVLATGAVQTVGEGTGLQARDEFVAGTSAMIFTSNSVLESFFSVAGEKGHELGVARLPKVNAADTGGVCPGGSSVYILNHDDEQKIAKAWEFVKTWVSADYQTEWALGTGCIPVNKLSMETEEMKSYINKRPEFYTAYDAMMSSNPNVQEHLSPTQQAFTTIFKECGDQFAAGQLSVDECVSLMAERCNAALDEYNRANPVN